MKSNLFILAISSIILVCVTLNSKHTVLSPVYSAQEYFNSMNSTQQNFENKLSALNSQIAEIDTIIKDKNKTTSLKITSMS
jgi:peptidoglycan hydrolase CwlO-like protein